VLPQFGAPLTDGSRVIIYNRNVFILQATDVATRQCGDFSNRLPYFVTAVNYGRKLIKTLAKLNSFDETLTQRNVFTSWQDLLNLHLPGLSMANWG